MSRIAVLSTAHIHTKTFIEAIKGASDGRSVAAIWDDEPERGEAYAKLAGAPFVADLDSVLANPEIDAFIICAENTRHLPLLEKVLPLGKPVFCEKPLVTNAEELAKLNTLLATSSAPLMSGYFYPFSSEFQAVAREVAGGTLGQITRVSFLNAHHAAYAGWFDQPALQWFAEPALAGGGALMDLGTHAVHLLTTLFGPVKEVWAEIANHSGNYTQVDDYGIILLRFENGVLGRAEAAWTQTGGGEGLTVVGSKGTIWRTPAGYVQGQPDCEPQPLTPAPECPRHVDRLVAIVRGELSAQAVQADLQAALRAVAIMNAAYRSVEKGGWVPVEA